jgi:glycosyltransferase involved in cell wall biosynthesis
MNPATSVIIPCYNGEKYLPQALESVRAQTVPVREIIVVDDGSQVPLQPMAGWDGPPLRIIRTTNQGLAAARNVGLHYATGEFIALLDSDDFWHPRKVEVQEKALRADPGAAACYAQCVRAPGFFGFGPYPPPDVSDDEFLLVLWYHSFFPPSAVAFRRDAVEAVGPFREDLGNGEDIELWLRLLTRGRFVQAAEPLCYYRQHDGQFTQNIYRKLIGGKRARAAMIALHAQRLIQAGLRPDKLWDAYRNDVLVVYYRRQFHAARPLLWDYWRSHLLDAGIFYRALASLLPSWLVARLRGRLGTAAASPEESGRPDSRWRESVRMLSPVLGNDHDASRSHCEVAARIEKGEVVR